MVPLAPNDYFWSPKSRRTGTYKLSSAVLSSHRNAEYLKRYILFSNYIHLSKNYVLKTNKTQKFKLKPVKQSKRGDDTVIHA